MNLLCCCRNIHSEGINVVYFCFHCETSSQTDKTLYRWLKLQNGQNGVVVHTECNTMAECEAQGKISLILNLAVIVIHI